MSDKIPTPQSQSEEVDLGKLFQIIGNGFKNLFNSISNFFKWIFYRLIETLLFFKKNAIIFAVAMLIGGAIGYFLDVKKKPMYSSKMVVETNFDSGHLLYNQLDYVNSLIEQKDSITLGKIFKKPSNEISSLKNLKVEPYELEKNLKVEYDNYIKNTDTIYTFAQNFTIDDFKQRMSDPDFRLQQITAVSSNPQVVLGLESVILSLVNNEYFQKKYDLKNQELQIKKNTLKKDLAQIDSLRVLYKKVALLEAKKEYMPTTNINLSSKEKQENLDLALFKQRSSLLYQLKNLNKEILKSGFVIKAVTDFNKGKKVNSILTKKWVLGVISSFFIVLFFLLIIRINNYLNKYSKL